MDISVDDVREFIQILGEIIVISAPIVAAIYYKFHKKYTEKLNSLKLKDTEKNRQEFLNFSHQKSMLSMRNLKDICNLFFDKSHADRVLYFQLENGTMADSQLQNMFLTCMAESDRYSNIPEWMTQVQRMPIQSIVSFIEKINHSPDGIDLIISKDTNNILDKRIRKKLLPEEVSAFRVRTVHNRQGYIIGYVVFEYLFDDMNDESEFFSDEMQKSLINECRSSIETELLRYRNQIRSKKAELKL